MRYSPVIVIKQNKRQQHNAHTHKTVKHTHLRDMFKMAFKSVCISTVMVSPDPLSPLYQLL